MLVLVAYSVKPNSAPGLVVPGIARMERHYEIGQHEGVDLPGGTGIHLWRTPDPGCHWPHWVSGPPTLATAYPPVGYEQVTGTVDVAGAATGMPRTLIEHPDRVLDLTPPFAAAAVDPARPDELHLWTDLLGVGRLFALRTDTGWVFANRPAAALLFAGALASPSARAWLQLAGCEWAMGDRTAYRGVKAVPAATHVVCRAGRRHDTSTDVARLLADQAGGSLDQTVDRAADGLRATAGSVRRLWTTPPRVDLSGGRDSRVTAAAFLGEDPVLTTHESVPPGEAAVAEHLVALLPGPPHHEVMRTVPDLGGARISASIRLLDRARRWHDAAEVTRPVTYLWHDPATERARPLPLVGGAAGEVAHAFYYPPEPVAQRWRELSEDTRVDAMAEHLLWQLVAHRGPAPRVHDAVREQCRLVVTHAVTAGLNDERAVTWFYLSERLRRWSGVGERAGVVSPFLTPGVVLAAFAMTPAQRRADALHVALLRRLQPAWVGVLFFKPERVVPFDTVNRVGRTADHEQVAAVIADESAWRSRFRPRVIQQMWANSREGVGAPGQERFLARIVWRAAFDDHLVNLLAPVG